MKTAVCLATALKGHVGRPAAEKSTTAKLGFPGHCPDHPVLTTFLVDDSGSVVGPAGNDPLSNRYAEIAQAIRAVRRWCLCGHERVSVIHFDTPTSGCLSPTPLRQLRGPRLARSLRTPSDARGASTALPALVALTDGLPGEGSTELVTVILSDWELFDTPIELARTLASLPGHLVAVGLGGEERPDVLPPGAQFIPITTASRPGSVAHAVFGTLKIHRRPLMVHSA